MERRPLHRRTLLLAALLGGAAPALSGCISSLQAFNALAPKDGAGERIAAGLAYGDHPRHRLDLYAPRERHGPAPVVVFFYGGSWRSGDRGEYAFVGRALAANGFVVAIPDYRLVPEARFPAFLEDCAAAVRWTQTNIAAHGGDGARVALMGHSAGAYNAIMLALSQRWLDEADANPVRGAVGLSGPYDFLPLDVPATRAAFGDAPQLELTQPVRFARGDAAPLFLAWGADDDLVGRRNIESLTRAQREAGGPVEAKIYPELDHAGTLLALSVPFRGRAPVLADAIDFLRRVTA